jgi:hypothetical protein
MSFTSGNVCCDTLVDNPVRGIAATGERGRGATSKGASNTGETSTRLPADSQNLSIGLDAILDFGNK